VDRYPNVRFTLFADDGIIFSNSQKEIEQIRKDPFLNMIGVIFSEKLKSDGTPATGYISGDKINLVGVELNVKTGMIQSPKGHADVKLSIEDLQKRLWNGYSDDGDKTKFKS